MEAVRTSETSVDNYFTRQYIPEDKSERRNLFGLRSEIRGSGENCTKRKEMFHTLLALSVQTIPVQTGLTCS
jgi:hypothetical protein